MAGELSMALTTPPFAEIWADAEFYLDLISSDLKHREIRPFAISASEDASWKGSL